MYSLTWSHQCSIIPFHALCNRCTYTCYVYIALYILSAFLSVVDLDISVRINPRYFKVSNYVSNLCPSYVKYIILIDFL